MGLFLGLIVFEDGFFKDCLKTKKNGSEDGTFETEAFHQQLWEIFRQVSLRAGLRDQFGV